MILDSRDYLVLSALTKQAPALQGQIPLSCLTAATGLCDKTVRKRLKILRFHGLVRYEKVAGRHLEFEINQSAYIVLNNMGVLYAVS